MGSSAAEPAPPAAETDWARLERAATGAANAALEWRTRAARAEREVGHLRAALEHRLRQAAGEDPDARLARLEAENVLLRSRTDDARRRVESLLERLRALEDRG